MRDGDQLLVLREIGKTQHRQPALARAEHLAGAAQPQILLGNAEAVLGLAQDRQALPRHLAERRLVQQNAGRGLVASADTTAELMQLREPEPFRMFTTMIVAAGTSMPTSMTVVATRRSALPLANSAIARSFSALFMRPCTRPTRPGSNSVSA